jgi:tetratricopeptide (TPR) repeat protein
MNPIRILRMEPRRRDRWNRAVPRPLELEPGMLQSHVRLVLSLVAAGVLGTLVGCSTGRPLHIIKADAADHADMGNYDLAAADYEQYLDKIRNDYKARAEYGKALLKINRPQDARREFSICIEAEPLNDYYWDMFAEALFQQKDHGELTTVLEQRCRDRGLAPDYLRTARFMNRMGHADDAATAYLTAAKIDEGKSFAIQKELADFYGERGDKANQVRRLRMALYLDRQNLALMEEVRRLGEIPGPSFWLPPAEAAPVAGVPEGR